MATYLGRKTDRQAAEDAQHRRDAVAVMAQSKAFLDAARPPPTSIRSHARPVTWRDGLRLRWSELEQPLAALSVAPRDAGLRACAEELAEALLAVERASLRVRKAATADAKAQTRQQLAERIDEGRVILERLADCIRQ